MKKMGRTLKVYKLVGVDKFVVNATLEEATNHARANGCTYFGELPLVLNTELKGCLVTGAQLNKLKEQQNEKSNFYRHDAGNSDIMRK